MTDPLSGPNRQPAASSPEERSVWDEALEPAQLRSLNSALRRLADADDAGGLRDAARRLLSGRVALRDAADDPVVSRELAEGTAALRGRWESLTDDEREQVREAGQEEPRDGAARPAGPPAGPGRSSARHSGGFSLY